MSWTTLRVQPSEVYLADALTAVLFDHGALAVQEEGTGLVTQFPDDDQLAAARAAVLAIDSAARLWSSPAPDIDWSVAWRAGAVAHRAGDMVVAPPWLASGQDAGRTVLIEPGMAFGTGDHPTTRGALRLLQRLIRPGDRVADLGAGSGVLSIAAAKLGAEWVAAVELDGDAVPDAVANVERNGVGGRVTVVEGDASTLLPLLAPLRLVIANIVSSVLIDMLPIIRGALSPDGVAILSGILTLERPAMLQSITAGGWRIDAEDEEDLWWSVAIA